MLPEYPAKISIFYVLESDFSQFGRIKIETALLLFGVSKGLLARDGQERFFTQVSR